MISLDTNILVRFITRDDPKQLAQVTTLFQNLQNKQAKAFICMLVILEIIWVLKHFYEIERDQIIESLLILFESEIFIIENRQKVYHLLVEAKETTFDLADVLIGCRYEVADNLPVVTFDKKASKIENFMLMKDFI